MCLLGRGRGGGGVVIGSKLSPFCVASGEFVPLGCGRATGRKATQRDHSLSNQVFVSVHVQLACGEDERSIAVFTRWYLQCELKETGILEIRFSLSPKQ